MNVERHFVFSVVFSSAGMMTIFCPFESVVTWLDFFSVFALVVPTFRLIWGIRRHEKFLLTWICRGQTFLYRG